MSALICLEPALSDAAYGAFRDAVHAFGPLPAYVDSPRDDGLGAGLTRRHDALVHYVKQRYANGVMESMADTAARTNLYRGTFAEAGRVLHPAAAALMAPDGYVEAARAISGCSVVEPDMLYVNVLVPGQELAIHTDTPEFRGMAKGVHPEWLLVVMHHSGLFERWRMHIAGGVTFFNTCRGGEFLAYDNGPTAPRSEWSVGPNRAVLLDADTVFHGVSRVGGPDHPAPPARPDSTLEFTGSSWVIRLRGEDRATYDPDEVRLSVQWKARCFAHETERRAAHEHTDDLDAHEVIATLRSDLRERGVDSEGDLDGSALAITLIETYIGFPDASGEA